MKNKKVKVGILSLGCARNLYDSEKFIYRIKRKGFKITPIQKSDIAILNTCGFIKEAKEESIQAILELIDLKKRKKIKKIILMGCFVKRYGKKLLKYFPQVDALYDIYTPFSVPKERYFLEDTFYAFLKISEGCSNRCSYCAIPLMRGEYKSRDLKSIVEEAKYLESVGKKELILVSQDTAMWGRDLKEKLDLTYLLKTLLKETKKIRWIRLLYLHPLHVTDSLLDLMRKEERICKYLDIPLQHVNDRILRLMRRNMTKKDIENLIDKIREKVPGIFLRTTFIVGFPSETDSDFGELLEFIKEKKFERVGCFIYSKEEGTLASDFYTQIPHKVKEKRYKILMEIQRDISYRINEGLLNKELEVLIEEKNGSVYIGRSQFSAPLVDGLVFVKGDNIKLGEFYKVKVTQAYEYDLEAEVVKPS